VAAVAATQAIASLGLCFAADSAAKRFPVTPQMVMNAMKSRSIPVDGVQVTLSAPITSATPNPELEVQSVSMTGTHRAMLRLACKNTADCIPFYISAAWQDDASIIPLPALAPTQQTHTASMALQPTDFLRAGTPAVLTIDDDRLHIQLRVITLQSGSQGEMIRVTTPDRRRAFVAEVINSRLLKGSF